MRSFALLACAAVLVGCTKPEDRAVGAGATTDTMAAPAGAGAAAATISLKDVAGTWKVRSTDERGGTPIETELRQSALVDSRTGLANRARFVINQIGYHARKDDELLRWMAQEDLRVPVLANVFVLSPAAARVLNSGRVPGVIVTDELLELALRHGREPDGGRSFFLGLAAKQLAEAKAVVKNLTDVENLLLETPTGVHVRLAVDPPTHPLSFEVAPAITTRRLSVSPGAARPWRCGPHVTRAPPGPALRPPVSRQFPPVAPGRDRVVRSAGGCTAVQLGGDHLQIEALVPDPEVEVDKGGHDRHERRGDQRRHDAADGDQDPSPPVADGQRDERERRGQDVAEERGHQSAHNPDTHDLPESRTYQGHRAGHGLDRAGLLDHHRRRRDQEEGHRHQRPDQAQQEAGQLEQESEEEHGEQCEESPPGGPLARRKRAHTSGCLHTQEYTTCQKTSIGSALGAPRGRGHSHERASVVELS